MPYQDLNDLVQLCIKVEQQILRKNFQNDYSNSYTKKEFKREGKQVKEEPFKSFKEKEKPREGTSSHTRTSEIKCFKCHGRGHVASQCPTKKTMILKGVDHYSIAKMSKKVRVRLLVMSLRKFPILVKETF